MTLILIVSNVVWIMAFNSQKIGRHVQGLTNPNVVGTVYFDDADKLHSDLIDLDIRVKEANQDELDDEEGLFKSLTESIASGKYSITAERKISNKEVGTFCYFFSKVTRTFLI